MALIEGKCKATVRGPGGWQRYQCSRNATKDGFCGIHHPDAEKARRAKTDAKWEAESAKREAANARSMERDRRAEAFPDLLEALRVLRFEVEEIAPKLDTYPDSLGEAMLQADKAFAKATKG